MKYTLAGKLASSNNPIRTVGAKTRNPEHPVLATGCIGSGFRFPVPSASLLLSRSIALRPGTFSRGFEAPRDPLPLFGVFSSAVPSVRSRGKEPEAGRVPLVQRSYLRPRPFPSALTFFFLSRAVSSISLGVCAPCGPHPPGTYT